MSTRRHRLHHAVQHSGRTHVRLLHTGKQSQDLSSSGKAACLDSAPALATAGLWCPVGAVGAAVVCPTGFRFERAGGLRLRLPKPAVSASAHAASVTLG